MKDTAACYKDQLKPPPAVFSMYAVRETKMYQQDLYRSLSSMKVLNTSNLANWATCLHRQLHAHDVRVNKGGVAPVWNWQDAKYGCPKGCEHHKTGEAKKKCMDSSPPSSKTGPAPREPNLSKPCVAQVRVSITQCSTCCCKDGLVSTNVQNKLVVGRQTTCGGWFATMDNIVRTVASGSRWALLVHTFNGMCFAPS